MAKKVKGENRFRYLYNGSGQICRITLR